MAFSLVDQPRFRAAFDFMRLRAEIGEVDVVLADWWQEFSMADDATREDLVFQVKLEQQKPARSARVHREAPAGDPKGPESGLALPSANTSFDAAGATLGEPAADAPKKRRRRRRKPAGGSDGSNGSSTAGV